MYIIAHVGIVYGSDGSCLRLVALMNLSLLCDDPMSVRLLDRLVLSELLHL